MCVCVCVHSGTDSLTVELKIGRLHKMAEEVSVVLQVRRGEQPEVLDRAVRHRLHVEEAEKAFLPLSPALVHDVNHLQYIQH